MHLETDMKYEAIENQQDALDMLESDLITIHDYINICKLNKWAVHKNECVECYEDKDSHTESNIIHFKKGHSGN